MELIIDCRREAFDGSYETYKMCKLIFKKIDDTVVVLKDRYNLIKNKEDLVRIMNSENINIEEKKNFVYMSCDDGIAKA